MKRLNKEWILTQLEALPYIMIACAVCGWLWFIASMAVALLGR